MALNFRPLFCQKNRVLHGFDGLRFKIDKKIFKCIRSSIWFIHMFHNFSGLSPSKTTRPETNESRRLALNAEGWVDRHQLHLAMAPSQIDHLNGRVLVKEILQPPNKVHSEID